MPKRGHSSFQPVNETYKAVGNEVSPYNAKANLSSENLMTRFYVVIFAGFLFSLGLAQDKPFPSISGKTLTDISVTLPADFSSANTVVFMPLQQEQQKDFSSWESYIKDLASKNPRLDFLQLLPIGELNFLLRGIITSAMRGEYDDEVEARSVPLFSDPAPLLAAFSLADDSAMQVMLVRGGNIVWQTSGMFSDEKAAALETALESERPPER